MAAAQCEERARDAVRGPQGRVGVGVNSDGKVSTGISVGISLDALSGKSPEEIYEDCVMSKTGEAPIRPLEL